MKKILLIIFVCAAMSCTPNIRSKEFGGKSEVKLLPYQRVITVTWKDADMWILTEPMKATDTPRVLTFQENSTYGILNGQVTIYETK